MAQKHVDTDPDPQHWRKLREKIIFLQIVIFAFCQQQKPVDWSYPLSVLDPDSIGVVDLDPGMQRWTRKETKTAHVLPVLKSWIFSFEGWCFSWNLEIPYGGPRMNLVVIFLNKNIELVFFKWNLLIRFCSSKPGSGSDQYCRHRTTLLLPIKVRNMLVGTVIYNFSVRISGLSFFLIFLPDLQLIFSFFLRWPTSWKSWQRRAFPCSWWAGACPPGSGAASSYSPAASPSYSCRTRQGWKKPGFKKNQPSGFFGVS